MKTTGRKNIIYSFLLGLFLLPNIALAQEWTPMPSPVSTALKDV